MAKRPGAGCKACNKQNNHCDGKRPSCGNCVRRKVSCNYPIQLKWGGRPYKNKSKTINIPAETMLVEGILVAKQRMVSRESKEAKVKDFVLVKEPLNFRYNSPPPENQLQLIEQIPTDEPLLTMKRMLDLPMSFPPLSFMPTVSKPLLDSHSELLRFFVEETSSFFVVSHRSGSSSNPFGTIIPRMASECPILKNLLIAFAGKHRNKVYSASNDVLFLHLEELCAQDTDYEDLSRRLLKKSTNELMGKLTSLEERHNDSTLAGLLVLIALEIFFGDHRSKWRMHLRAARQIVGERLQNDSEATGQKLIYRVDNTPYHFLSRWFTYLNVVSILSSADFELQADTVPLLEVEFFSTKQQLLETKRSLDDIEATSGMDLIVLSFLSRVAHLLHKANNEDIDRAEVMRTAIELDFELIEYLDESEKARNAIVEQLKKGSSKAFTEEQFQNYERLRATNLVFGLTGSLLLRGRLMAMSHDSKMICSLLSRTTALLTRLVQLGSPSQSCLFFCIFCCGCELLSSSMEVNRPVFTRQLDSLAERGMTSALQAKIIMEECWTTGRHWWKLLRENNLDFCFAI